MAVIIWPDYRVARFSWRKANQATTFKSVFGSQSLEAATPLVEVSMTGVSESRVIARQIQATIDALDGFKNQLALWNLELPVPAGTMRGAMTLAASISQGATVISVAGGASQAAKTLLAGDLLGFGAGINQQVVRVAANATANASGTIALTLSTPLRYQFAAGDAIAWDHPKALFRLASAAPAVNFGAEGAEAWALDLIEDWRP
ncbi:MAG: hypothetical protein ACRYGK_14425 [Janthinobacterium lividum]